jgi:hypothetical protein
MKASMKSVLFSALVIAFGGTAMAGGLVEAVRGQEAAVRV